MGGMSWRNSGSRPPWIVIHGNPWREAWEDPNLEDEARAFLMGHPEVRKDLLLDQASDRDTPSHKRKL